MVLLGMGRALEPGSWLPANMLAETSTLGQGNLIPHTIGNDVGPVPKMAMMSIKVLGGMVTFGDQPPPIDLYNGPTSPYMAPIWPFESRARTGSFSDSL